MSEPPNDATRTYAVAMERDDDGRLLLRWPGGHVERVPRPRYWRNPFLAAPPEPPPE